jgi:hypothetical protein
MSSLQMRTYLTVIRQVALLSLTRAQPLVEDKTGQEKIFAGLQLLLSDAPLKQPVMD